MQIIAYQTEEEKQEIIASKLSEGLLLVNVSNVKEGNFLGFTENPLKDPTPIEQQVAQLQQDNVILMDALATTFEEILNLQAQVAALQGGTV